jgi:succinylglutamate desuccinylase
MPLSRQTSILNFETTNFYAVGLYKKYAITLEWGKLLPNKSTKFRQNPNTARMIKSGV